MAASARTGERATSFAVACSLLSRFVRQNGAAAAELGLGIKGEAEPQRAPATMSLLPGAEAEEAERRKETMELFPQSAGFGVQDAREQEKKEKSQQLTIFYGGKILVFNDFPADKAKDLMQLASKSSAVVQNVGLPQPSAPATVTDNTKVHKAMPAPVSSLPVAQAAVAPKPSRTNASGTYYSLSSCCYCCAILIQASKYGLASLVMLIIHRIRFFSFVDMPIARKASLHRFLEKRKDRLNTKTPYQTSPADTTPVKKEPESQPWLGLGPNAVKSNLS
ncbi:Protein TIFY 10b [Dichanthelium oligosanthes]|uniref:Protein TIFY n=1 Tax=Dichanthelium oligosanthes TaxID=888268 RepID=A0A1E5V9R3_9POAL|nr:Protein TIFY 10b [Dichanthelium oligosanthes]